MRCLGIAAGGKLPFEVELTDFGPRLHRSPGTVSKDSHSAEAVIIFTLTRYFMYLNSTVTYSLFYYFNNEMGEYNVIEERVILPCSKRRWYEAGLPDQR